jgi:hypothetical protein
MPVTVNHIGEVACVERVDVVGVDALGVLTNSAALRRAVASQSQKAERITGKPWSRERFSKKSRLYFGEPWSKAKGMGKTFASFSVLYVLASTTEERGVAAPAAASASASIGLTLPHALLVPGRGGSSRWVRMEVVGSRSMWECRESCDSSCR